MSSDSAVVAFNWAFVGIAFLFLALRGWVRVIRRTRVNLSDLFVFFSWIGFVADSIGHTLLHNLGLELSPSKDTTVAVNADPRTLVQVYKIIYGLAIVYPATLWLTKASILVFYFELFPFNQKRLRMGLYLTTAFTASCYIVVLYLDAFFCLPISSNWSLDPNTQCITGISPMIFIVFAVSNILCDLLIFILPFFLLRQLRRLSRRQIWGLCIIFSLGGITVCTSIGRTLAIAFMADTTHVGVWSVLEVGVGIIVACCPALRVLLRKAGDQARGSRSRGHGASERSAQSRPGLASRSSRGMLMLNPGNRDLGGINDQEMDSRATPDEKDVYALKEIERDRTCRGLGLEERTIPNGDISLETVAFRHCENRPRWN